MMQKYSSLSKWILRKIFGINILAIDCELQKSSLNVKKVKKELSVCRKKLIDSYDEIRQEKRRYLIQEKQLKDLEVRIGEYDLKIAACQHKAQQQKALISDLQKAFGDVNQIKKDLEEDCQKYKSRIESLQDEISACRINLGKSNVALRQEKNTLSAQVEKVRNLEYQLHESDSHIENLNKIIENQEGIVRNLEADKKQLQKGKDSAEKEMESIKKKLTSTEKDLETIFFQNADLQKQLVEVKTKAEEQYVQIQNQSKKLASMESNEGEHCSGEDYEDIVKKNKELSQLLAENEGKLQILAEKNVILLQKKDTIKYHLERQKNKNKDLHSQIDALLTLKQENESEINQHLSRIQELEKTASAVSFDDDNDKWDSKKPGEEVSVRKVTATADVLVEKENSKDIVAKISSMSEKVGKEVSEESESDLVDMPVLNPDGTVINKRSIKEVNNLDTGECIDTDEFFERSKEEISQYSRRLEIISRTGDKPLLVCAQCKQPVKISKITKAYGESLFFIHNSHNVVCSWKKEHSFKVLPLTNLSDDEEQASKEEFSRYKKIKQLIYDTLSEQRKNGDDITDVIIDKNLRISGNRDRLRVDVFAQWNGLKIMFKLQRTYDTIQDLVSYDEFCKKHNIFIIWIFGSDARNHYSYLLEHNYQNTIFDNHSCVYVLDKEAEDACVANQCLTLKCNWLEDGKNWHYTLSKDKANGVLITLNDLAFNDNRSYKPYYKKIPVFYQKKYDEVILLRSSIYKYRLGKLWGLYNQEEDVSSICKYTKIWIDEYRRIAAELPGLPEPKRGLLSDNGEEIYSERIPLEKNLYLITFFGVSYLADSVNEKVSKEYDEIVMWCHDRLIVKDGDRYGVIDYKGKCVIEFIYSSFRKIDSERAEVVLDGNVFSVNINGKPVSDEEILLKDGFVKVRIQNKWGIKDSNGNFVVKCLYDEIASFRCRFFGFLKNEGLIKLAKAPHYNYRIPFSARFISKNANNNIFELCGVILNMPKNNFNYDECTMSRSYDCYLLNIETKKGIDERYTIAKADSRSYKLRMSHVDLEDDFELNKVYKAKVVDIRRNMRLILKFPDGKKSYISKGRIQRSGRNPEQYAVGSYITLKKVDFELYYESTVWQIVDGIDV